MFILWLTGYTSVNNVWRKRTKNRWICTFNLVLAPKEYTRQTILKELKNDNSNYLLVDFYRSTHKIKYFDIFYQIKVLENNLYTETCMPKETTKTWFW